MIFTVDVEFLAALVLDPLVTIKIKTFNAFESRIIVLHIRWMPAWGWALLFCRMDRWASMGTWGSAERPRACISCTCSWRLRTISGHHITATWNNRPPWRSTWPSQKIWSRYLKRSINQIKPQDWASFLLFILRMEVINYEFMNQIKTVQQRKYKSLRYTTITKSKHNSADSSKPAFINQEINWVLCTKWCTGGLNEIENSSW